jgi:hypothetical protein
MLGPGIRVFSSNMARRFATAIATGRVSIGQYRTGKEEGRGRKNPT